MLLPPCSPLNVAVKGDIDRGAYLAYSGVQIGIVPPRVYMSDFAL